MHKTYTRLAGAAIAAGIGLGTAGLAPLATAEPTPHAQTDRHLSDAQKRAFDDTVKKINDQVRGSLGASISDARVEHKDGKDVLSWDVDTHKLRDILNMSDDNAVLATALPDGVDASSLRTGIDTVTLSDLAHGSSAEGKAVIANLPSADQLSDPKVRDALNDAISKAADSGLWPEIKPLVDKAGGADKFADQLLSARGISANDISSLSRSVGGDKAAPSVFIPFDKSTDKVTLSADITDGSFGDNTRDKVAKASTPLAFTVGDVTLLDGKIDPNLVNHVPADIRATQIGNTTLGQVLKDVIASINDVLGDIRDNVGDRIDDGDGNLGDRIDDRLDNIGDGDSIIPTEGNSGSEDAEAILDRIREILNPENKPTPPTTESETETSTTESKKPDESESDDDKETDKPAEPTDKKDEDKKPTKDEAREALEVLERYVNETDGKDKPADSTDKTTESGHPSEKETESASATSSAEPTESSTESSSAKSSESESTSPSKKPGIMDSIFGGGDSEGGSSNDSSNEPVDQPAGDTGVVSPAVNEAPADNADTQSGGSAPAGGEEKSAPRDRSQDSVFADRQGSSADDSAPQEENEDYNTAAEGSMPVTGASSATKWMLGGAVALILGGLGAIIALRRKEVQ